MKRHLLLSFLSIVLAVNLIAIKAVLAQSNPSIESTDDFLIEIDTLQGSLFSTVPEEPAKYDLYITNNLNFTDYYRIIFTDDPRWSFEVRPDSRMIKFPVEGKTKVPTRVLVKPTTPRINYGQYNLLVTIISETNKVTKNVGLQVFVKDPTSIFDRSYLPVVTFIVDAPTKIDPREASIMTISLENRNPLNITDMVIQVDSRLNDLNDEVRKEVKLGPLEKKKLTFTLGYNPRQSPTTDIITINASIPSKNKQYDPITKSIEIVAYSSLVTDSNVKEGFLKREERITYFNDGNVPRKDVLKLRTSLIEQMFSSSTPKATNIKEQGTRYFVWEIELGPEESKQVVIVQNYRPIFVFFILVLVMVFIYYYFRSPVVVRKTSRNIKPSKALLEEGFSDVKIILHVKNRTNKVIDEVTLIDRLPNIIDPEKEFTSGTLQPTRVIKHQKNGVVIKWEIGSLEPFEERIITYDVVSKLKIIGPFIMPSASVRYKNRFNRYSRVYSNKLTIGGILKED
ncbi:MAG: hypothetical protein QXK37_00005 [Candidatus Woesearchaeota archaeon]